MRADTLLLVAIFLVEIQSSTVAALSSSSRSAIKVSYGSLGEWLHHPFSHEKFRRSKSELSSASSFWSTSGEHFTMQEQNTLQEIGNKDKAVKKRQEEAQAHLATYEKLLPLLRSQKAVSVAAASKDSQQQIGGTISETAVRSVIKSIMWRVVAGSVTLVTSLRFSGSIATALQVVGADFFSKALTMFLGERLMNKCQAGRRSGSDNIKRSIAKALIWRLFAIANTLTLAVFVSKDWGVASKIASTDALFKTVLMFFYERIWTKIEWGKEYLLELTNDHPASDTMHGISWNLRNCKLAHGRYPQDLGPVASLHFFDVQQNSSAIS